jgi:outer membrane protein
MAYCDVVRDQSVVDLYVADITELRALLKNTEQRVALGELTKTDEDQASGRLAGAELNLESAEQQLVTSRAEFEHAVGRPPEALRTSGLPKVPNSEDDVLKIALRENPGIVQSQAQARAADANVSVAIGALMPSLSVQAQYGRSINDIAPGITENGVTVIGQISMPIYQGGTEEAAVRQAKEQRSQATFQIFESERQVRESVRTSWNALLTARRSIQLATLESESDNAAYHGAQIEAQVGARTTLDILNANQELLQSKIATLTAICANQTATFQVMSAMGHLTAQALKLPVKPYDPLDHYNNDADRWIGLGD